MLSTARSAALLLVLFAGAVSSARTPTSFQVSGNAYGRSLLQEQSSCCALVDATATGGSVACSSSGLVLTVAPSQFAPIATSISVVGKAGYTAASNPAALAGQTCSSRYGPAAWASAGGATTLATTATDTTCATGTEGSCQGLVTRLTPKGKLAVAARHSCTIRATDGAVLCSGENNWGQLGTGNTANSTSLVAALAPGSGAGILTDASWVAAGGYFTTGSPSGHTCACLTSGEAVCWGQNRGQLGAAVPLTTAFVSRPTYVVTDAAGTVRLANCKSVAANLNHTLFLTADGAVYAAGRNGFAELGLGNTAMTNFAARVNFGSAASRPATGVCAGKRHSCAVFEDGTVACAGNNGYGQLGRGVAGPAGAGWASVAGISDAVDVECGEVSTCVLRKGGKVSCWGMAIATGNGVGTGNQLTPFDTIPSGAVDLATGDRHGCAILEDATVSCWGTGSYGSYGQLGDGQTPPATTWLAPQTSNFVGAMAISAGPMATCILNGIGERFCAGNGQYGQLGTPVASVNNPTPALTASGGAAFAVPPPFVTISDGSKPVCSLLLTVKVAATCDPTPAVFNPALEDITADATTTDGAVVTFSPTAEDEGVPVDVTCTPASGSQFALGPTTVTCQAGVTTGAFTVTVVAPSPAFAANAPTAAFETSSTAGTSLEGKYRPIASDPVDGDLSSAVETYLVPSDEQIFLSGPNAYIFPVGTTNIRNVVTNSFGVGSEEFVSIVVTFVGPKPVVTVNTKTVTVTQPDKAPAKTIRYDDACTATSAIDEPVTITYDPPSGQTVGTTPFAVGTTSTVTCTATTASGSTATGTFTVVVRRPPGQDGKSP